jgi:hypothetical protein
MRAMGSVRSAPGVCLAIAVLMAAACSGDRVKAPPITPATMQRIGTVDERYQSYNVTKEQSRTDARRQS